MERIPFTATRGPASHRKLKPLPVCAALDNVRSLYNVGAFFRTADGAGVERLYLCGYTGRPPDNGISKTALGAEMRVPWEHRHDACWLVEELRERGHEVAAVETSPHSLDLFDWRPNFPVCVVFGNEVEGLREAVLERVDTHIRIPMLGLKHSLNVATAGGVVLYELLRKYRRLVEHARR